MNDSGNDIEAIGNRRICFKCIEEKFLSDEVERDGEQAVCNYCHKKRPTISIGELADRFETVFDDHFERTPTEPSAFEYAMAKESSYSWTREGDPVVDVIGAAAEIDERAAEDVRAVLDDRTYDREADQMGEESPFGKESHYIDKRIRDSEWQAEWASFEQSIKTETRFFNQRSEAILDSIFSSISDHKTFKGHSIIRLAGPNTRIPMIYRARVFQSDEKLEAALLRPDQEVGSPPPVAATAGRMNARGIGVFYASTRASVALAEVRPPIGSRVVLGRFALIRPLRLLDVDALRSVYVKGSLFDKSFIRELEKAKFLESLSERITVPVMPDNESLEYLITQAIADYLASKGDLNIDGLVYPSIQVPQGKNIVLFHKAARVEPLDRPDGIEMHASLSHMTEEGPEIDYYVFEEVPPKAEDKKREHRSGFDIEAFTTFTDPTNDHDDRAVALRLDVASLTVHHVRAVRFRTDTYQVLRHRTTKGKRGF